MNYFSYYFQAEFFNNFSSPQFWPTCRLIIIIVVLFSWTNKVLFYCTSVLIIISVRMYLLWSSQNCRSNKEVHCFLKRYFYISNILNWSSHKYSLDKFWRKLTIYSLVCTIFQIAVRNFLTGIEVKYVLFFIKKFVKKISI